ncbi:glycosyltransferase family 39 protein [Leptolyngbya ohadii]|uniref:glycosyltransferase family 39 protein n=1 Tax=Leptolyngbya ohadii TaxID=1962290 RepID=UPI0015C5D1D0|nr:glycosyltransferase family 39 protein [Leptolyngbya ohadii]
MNGKGNGKGNGIWKRSAYSGCTKRSQIWFIVIPLLLGIFLRFTHLADKVYWVDEVATSIRIAGTTRAQVTEQFATGQILTVQQLLDVQTLDPALPWSATFNALRQSPEHAPLYFLLARLWMQFLGHEIGHETGNSIAQIRSLSVLFSLLSLPAMFWLSSELFRGELWRSAEGGYVERSRQVSLIAVSLLSVSPFFVAYAQEARPYSLWSLSLLLMGASLLRAIRTEKLGNWILYAFSAAIGLYTSLLSLPVFLGQGVYVAICWGRQKLFHWGFAAIASLLLFSPWIWVIVSQLDTVQDNTTWTRLPLGFLPMVAIWLYTLAVLFFDVPVVTNPAIVGLAQIATATALVGLMGFALRELIRKTPRKIWLFLITFCVALPIPLIVFDLFANGRLSTAPRYLMPVHLGILLTIAFLLFERIPDLFTDLFKNPFEKITHSSQSAPLAPQFWEEPKQHRRFWSGVFAGLIFISLCSCLFQLQQPSRYHKSRSLSNPPIAAIVNQTKSPLVLAEASQTMDLLSLSHLLNPDVRIRIGAIDALPTWADDFPGAFVFNPSIELQENLQKQGVSIQNRYQPQQLVPTEMSLSLWQVQ